MSARGRKRQSETPSPPSPPPKPAHARRAESKRERRVPDKESASQRRLSQTAAQRQARDRRSVRRPVRPPSRQAYGRNRTVGTARPALPSKTTHPIRTDRPSRAARQPRPLPPPLRTEGRTAAATAASVQRCASRDRLLQQRHAGFQQRDRRRQCAGQDHDAPAELEI